MGWPFFFLNCSLISGVAEAMRRAQRKAREAKEQAEAASKAKSIFLSNMSHELRTPLNAILGFSRLMKSPILDSADQLAYADIIVRSGEHLLELINNILDISKIETGKVILKEQNTDLPRMLVEIGALLEPKIKEKELAFEVELARDLPQHILVDAAKLRQVIINLIGNATKFTHRGRIILRVTVTGKRSASKMNLRFEVEDTGVGIKREDRERIFSSFVQLNNDDIRESGTGLGLAISKQFVVLMGGEIGLESNPGKGTVIHFAIPVTVIHLSTNTTNLRSARAVRIADGFKKPRILIAEDHADNRLLLHKLLEPLGIVIKDVGNGKEAVEQFKSWQPDLILMDMRMPIMDGIEATKIIKDLPNGMKTKIIAVTAHVFEEERQMVLDSGCDDFVRKPFNEMDLLNTIAKHLGIAYQYEEEAILTEEPCELSSENIHEFSRQFIEDLIKPLEELDSEACISVIRQNPALSDDIKTTAIRMIETIRHEELLTLLEEQLERRGNESA